MLRGTDEILTAAELLKRRSIVVEFRRNKIVRGATYIHHLELRGTIENIIFTTGDRHDRHTELPSYFFLI